MSGTLLSKVKTLVAAAAAQTADSPPAKPAEENAPSWSGQVAVLTGVLAALTGFLTVRSTMLTNEAIYESNLAILSQTQASDEWSEYQANSVKAHMVELQLLPSSHLSDEDRKKLAQMDNDLRSRQPASKQNANDKIKERQTHLDTGLKKLKQKDLLGYAGMIAQIGIALASVAALLRRRSVFLLGVAAGGAGIAITAYVFVADYLGW
jgi:hypothetical protein